MARKPKLDTILVDAVDTARDALAEIAGASEIGEHLGVTAEGERLVTHRFVSHKKGYHGWTWFATLARVPRAKAKDLTICEVGIIAGEDSLLSPAWVPWADRLAKEEIEAAQAAEAAQDQSEAEQASGQTSAQGSAKEAESADTTSSAATDAEVEDATEAELQPHKSPARRQVRRRRTAQRTAARRRAAQRNRTRKES